MDFRKHYFILFAVLLTVVIFTAGCTGSTTPVTTEVTPTPQVTSTASIPDIVGVWTGTVVGHTENDEFRESGVPWYNITEQNGQSFTGYKVYTRMDGTEGQENMSGVISFDGKTIYIVDHDDGVISGEFMGPDEVELRYLMDGENAMALILHLTREEI